MMRQFLSFVIAALFAAAIPSGAQPSVQSVRVPIIMYHSVSPVGECNYIVTPQTLEEDFRFLSEHGRQAVTVQSLIDFAEGKGSLPEKPIVITFDDGFYNSLYYVLPLLEKYDFRACVGIVGSFAEKENGEKTRSPIYSYADYSDIAALSGSGRVEISNHSYAMHSVGARKGAGRKRGESDEKYREALQKDACACRDVIEKACGVTPKIYAYPYGCRTDFSDKVLYDLGYKALLTCAEGVNEIAFNQGGALLLKRYNRPSGLSREKFFRRMGVI